MEFFDWPNFAVGKTKSNYFRRGAPQGGFSCRFAAIHLLYLAKIPRLQPPGAATPVTDVIGGGNLKGKQPKRRQWRRRNQ
jgi:hypothetical protein